jgi:hypothetical protein
MVVHQRLYPVYFLFFISSKDPVHLCLSAADYLSAAAITKGPEMATRGGVNESLKFLSKYLAAVSNSNPQEANTNTVMTTTLEKGGCFLGTQRITTKQADRR